MDEHPEVIGDLWVLHHLDFYAELDKPSIHLLEACVARLPVEPWSLWRAKQLGGEKWLGWSIDTSMHADLIDALNFNTSATATNKKARLKQPVERPGSSRKTVEQKPRSVADMRWGDALASIGK